MALAWLGFGSNVNIEIEYETEGRKMVDIQRDNGKMERLPLYVGDEDVVKGKVTLNVKEGKKMDHVGVKLALIGHIESFYDRGQHYEFISKTRDLLEAGTLDKTQEFDFEFDDVEKQCESYNGINVRLRYFVRVTIVKSFGSNIVEEKDFWVYTYPEPPPINNTIKMEVGIEDCLHIEFEYSKSKYHLKDVVIGKIYFLLVRIKIKHMEIALIRRESTGSGSNKYNESETLTKFEIMDGAPVRYESIPVRLFLSGFDLTPTYQNIHNKFSQKWYLNLVLVDVEDRRYFKQQEITMWRKVPGGGIQQPTQAYSGKREEEEAKKREKKEKATRDELAKKKEREQKIRAEKEAEAKKSGKKEKKSKKETAKEDGDDAKLPDANDDEEDEAARRERKAAKKAAKEEAKRKEEEAAAKKAKKAKKKESEEEEEEDDDEEQED